MTHHACLMTRSKCRADLEALAADPLGWIHHQLQAGPAWRKQGALAPGERVSL